VHAPVSACASGAEGLAWAYRMIKSGELDVAIAGGAEACVHPLPMAGFSQMRAMSTRNDDPQTASRPFDLDRDGFVMGEGAGIMVLERRSHAEARGARIYGTLAGIGMSNDAFHITAPEPEGEGSVRAIAKALRTAGLSPADIGHVNAHATSTPVGDVAESKTILRAIGDHPVVTATKSMTGHMLGAAGAVEAIATLLAVRDGVVPGTRNLEHLDPEVKVDVAAENREVRLDAAINDSFGFGGHNVALIFTR
jgi:3-oxoacyl-[acyl-carrier-protein] synthase II